MSTDISRHSSFKKSKISCFLSFNSFAITAFEETTIDGEYAVYGIHTRMSKSVELSQAIYNIYTEEFFINVYLNYSEEDTKKALEETMDSFMID